MLIRGQPTLFNDLLRLRVGLIVQVLASELARLFNCSGQEASSCLLALPPSELKDRASKQFSDDLALSRRGRLRNFDQFELFWRLCFILFCPVTRSRSRKTGRKESALGQTRELGEDQSSLHSPKEGGCWPRRTRPVELEAATGWVAKTRRISRWCSLSEELTPNLWWKIRDSALVPGFGGDSWTALSIELLQTFTENWSMNAFLLGGFCQIYSLEKMTKWQSSLASARPLSRPSDRRQTNTGECHCTIFTPVRRSYKRIKRLVSCWFGGR